MKSSSKRSIQQSENSSTERFTENSTASTVEHPTERSVDHSTSQSSETYCGDPPKRSATVAAKYASRSHLWNHTNQIHIDAAPI